MFGRGLVTKCLSDLLTGKSEFNGINVTLIITLKKKIFDKNLYWRAYISVAGKDPVVIDFNTRIKITACIDITFKFRVQVVQSSLLVKEFIYLSDLYLCLWEKIWFKDQCNKTTWLSEFQLTWTAPLQCHLQIWKTSNL